MENQCWGTKNLLKLFLNELWRHEQTSPGWIWSEAEKYTNQDNECRKWQRNPVVMFCVALNIHNVPILEKSWPSVNAKVLFTYIWRDRWMMNWFNTHWQWPRVKFKFWELCYLYCHFFMFFLLQAIPSCISPAFFGKCQGTKLAIQHLPFFKSLNGRCGPATKFISHWICLVHKKMLYLHVFLISFCIIRILVYLEDNVITKLLKMQIKTH